jgi:formin 2
MQLREHLAAPLILGFLSIAGCARQTPTPETPPNPSPLGAQQTNLPPPPAAPPQPATYSAEGRIRQWNYAEDGRIDGFLLDNGTLICLPARFSGTMPPLRTRVEVSGSLHPSVAERTVVTAQLVVPAAGNRPLPAIAAAPPVVATGETAIIPPPPSPPPAEDGVAPPPTPAPSGAPPPPPPPRGRGRPGPPPPPPAL